MFEPDPDLSVERVLDVLPARLEGGPHDRCTLLLRPPVCDEIVFRTTGQRVRGRRLGDVVYRVEHDVWPDSEPYLAGLVYQFQESKGCGESEP